MEHEIDTTMLSSVFDYIALGHYHGQEQVADNAWYCGSQEYISYAEIGDTKGGLLVDLDRQTVNHLHLPCTPLIDLGELECESLSPQETGEEIAKRITGISDPARPAMAIITLAGITRRMLQAMDPGILRDARSRLLDLKIVTVSRTPGTPLIDRRDLTGVNYVDLFGDYLKTRNLDERKHRFVLEKGSAVIREVMAGTAGGEDAAH
jgi:DNA repair exonuclease SbcCD nuclease subunit